MPVIQRKICQCGNPKDHPQRPRPEGATNGQYCWTEPPRRPDGTRLLFQDEPERK